MAQLDGITEGDRERLDRLLGDPVLRDLVGARDDPEGLLPVAVEDVRAPLAADVH
jgi:hypothetical protein